MFCRFGSVEDSRPVAAIVWLYVVWIRPSSPAIGISESTIDILSLATSRCRSRCSRTGWPVCASRLVSASESVVYPVLIRLVLGRPSSVNSTSCSCLGEPRLNSCPTTAYAACSAAFTSPPRVADMAAKWSVSAAIPARSILASTSTSGSSTSRSSAHGLAPVQVLVQRLGQLQRWPGRAAPAAAAASRSPRAVQRELAVFGLLAQLLAQVAQRQVGQVEGALAGQRQVGGQRGVAGQPGQRQAAGGERVHRALGVVQRLGPRRVGQPGGQRLLVVLGQRGRVDVGAVTVRSRDRQAGHVPGAAPPGARWLPRPARSAEEWSASQAPT